MGSSPLNLRPREARRLAAAGSVLVLRPVELACFMGSSPGKYAWTSKRGEVHVNHREYPESDVIAEHCPLGPPGTRLWGREAWQQVPYGPHRDWPGVPDRRPRGVCESNRACVVIWRADGEMPRGTDGRPLEVWRPATHMPRHLSRFPDLIHASCRVVRVSSLTDGDAKSAGGDHWLCHFDGRAYDNAEREAIRATKRRDPMAPSVTYAGCLAAAWDRENPRHPWSSDPWAWACLVERGERT